jgi:hypothetical protein
MFRGKRKGTQMRPYGKIALYLFKTRCTTAKIDEALQIMVDQGIFAPKEVKRIKGFIDRLAAAS